MTILPIIKGHPFRRGLDLLTVATSFSGHNINIHRKSLWGKTFKYKKASESSRRFSVLILWVHMHIVNWVCSWCSNPTYSSQQDRLVSTKAILFKQYIERGSKRLRTLPKVKELIMCRTKYEEKRKWKAEGEKGKFLWVNIYLLSSGSRARHFHIQNLV